MEKFRLGVILIEKLLKLSVGWGKNMKNITIINLENFQSFFS